MADRISRRRILGFGAAAIVGSVGLNARQGKAATPEYGAGSTSAKTPEQRRLYWEKSYSGGPVDVKPLSPGLPGNDYKPVVIPNGATLPFKIVDSVKVFHLIAEEMDHAFDSGLHAKCWGFNGRVNGTVIEAVEGERVRIYVTNRLPVATSIHWHGFYLPNGMDGVGGLTQPYIKPGETAKYEWTLRQHGTLMFHSHHDEMTQMGMGMIGMFVVHLRNPATEYRVDRDFVLLLSEWTIEAGTARPNTLKMNDFNILTINGKVFPSTAPLVSKTGDKVRIRLGNLGAVNHHPFHIHGHHFRITATDGGDIPPFAQWPESTVLVGVGQTRNIEFITDAPGDWAFHCHMTHHTMNQMGHEFPNMVGMNADGLDESFRPLLPAYMTMGHTGMDMGRMAEAMPMPKNTISMKGAAGPFGDYISMGGMFTIVKVRDQLRNYNDDPGWYRHPQGTVALNASNAELERDGIDVSVRANGMTASGTSASRSAKEHDVMDHGQ